MNPYEPSKEQPPAKDKESRAVASFALGATVGVSVYWLFSSGLSMTLQTYRNQLFLMVLLHVGVFLVASVAAFVTYPRSFVRVTTWQRRILRFTSGFAFTIGGLIMQAAVRQSVEQMLSPGPITLVINLALGFIGALLLSGLIERAAAACFVPTRKIDEQSNTPKSPS